MGITEVSVYSISDVLTAGCGAVCTFRSACLHFLQDVRELYLIPKQPKSK
jgi:hypothetical protein